MCRWAFGYSKELEETSHERSNQKLFSNQTGKNRSGSGMHCRCFSGGVPAASRRRTAIFQWPMPPPLRRRRAVRAARLRPAAAKPEATQCRMNHRTQLFPAPYLPLHRQMRRQKHPRQIPHIKRQWDDNLSPGPVLFRPPGMEIDPDTGKVSMRTDPSRRASPHRGAGGCHG